ncbi:PREDICTED: uncharacterized protein LOC104819895 [Tarenaya hassleriana]|uniref:uncharacterized protein LOC104819895 n=1 Tax=Tarenaya hassleriana TaxID=28532 RepID=UPI00053C52FF|nr:PREDICTED: uncharacterized protein LOC104819895 [Tarenaya hassleriana]
MGALRRSVGLIQTKGCSNLFPGLPSSPVPMSQSNGPFSGLIICVTGLSRDARKQVKEATERLGGQYSPHLHPQCTHLVVQSFGGRKYEHALKHGPRNGLFIVTIAWFVDSVKRDVRMSESLYSVKKVGQNNANVDGLSRFLGPEIVCHSGTIDQGVHFGTSELYLALSQHFVYVDSDISDDLRNKVLRVAEDQGAKPVNSWFIGSGASLVVCEGASVGRYLGHVNTVVSPLWILKSVESRMQRLVHISPDLARHLELMLENLQNGSSEERIREEDNPRNALKLSKSKQEREEIVNIAKKGVRKRRSLHMQTCQNPIRQITQNSLMENICWTISEPTSSAAVFADSCSSSDEIGEPRQSVLPEGKNPGSDSVASFSNTTRPLTESEKTKVIFKDHFLTILFPVDRFSEMGPSSRTYFSENGFTCLQILDSIYRFYQENMADHEIEAAIHTDSRHADRLRTEYCSKETSNRGYMVFRRIELLGSRKSFEMLKRVNGDNNSNVYELVIRA